MVRLTVKEAAQLIGRDERTIRRWIQIGALAAGKAPNGRTVVERDDLERTVAQFPDSRQEEMSAEINLEMRVAALETEVTFLRERIAILHKKIDLLQVPEKLLPSEKIVPLSPLALPANRPQGSKPPRPGEPKDMIPLADFAASVNVGRSTIMGHLRDEHYKDEKINGKHYFTQEQARLARIYHQEHPQRGK